MQVDVYGPRYGPIHAVADAETGQRSYISNFVATYRLVHISGRPVTLNVRAIAERSRCVYPFAYEPSNLPALKTSMCSDGETCQPTALVYSTGSVVQIGDQTPEHALLTAHTLASIIFGRLGIPVAVYKFRVVNIVSCISIGFRTTLSHIEAAVPRWRVILNQDGDHMNTHRPYPAVRVRSRTKTPGSMVYLMYASGEVVIAGPKTREQVCAGIREVWEIRNSLMAIVQRPDSGAIVVSRSDRQSQGLRKANETLQAINSLAGPPRGNKKTSQLFLSRCSFFKKKLTRSWSTHKKQETQTKIGPAMSAFHPTAASVPPPQQTTSAANTKLDEVLGAAHAERYGNDMPVPSQLVTNVLPDMADEMAEGAVEDIEFSTSDSSSGESVSDEDFADEEVVLEEGVVETKKTKTKKSPAKPKPKPKPKAAKPKAKSAAKPKAKAAAKPKASKRKAAPTTTTKTPAKRSRKTASSKSAAEWEAGFETYRKQKVADLDRIARAQGNPDTQDFVKANAEKFIKSQITIRFVDLPRFMVYLGGLKAFECIASDQAVQKEMMKCPVPDPECPESEPFLRFIARFMTLMYPDEFGVSTAEPVQEEKTEIDDLF